MRIRPYTKFLTSITILSCLSLAALPQVRATESPYLLGDWSGSRSRLADEGVTFDAGYVNEVARKTKTSSASQFLVARRPRSVDK